MRSNTLIMLGASIAFGALAVLLARGWISNAVESEFRAAPSFETATAIVRPQSAATQPVLVAAHDIAFGEPLTRESFRLSDFPEDSVPLGIFSDFESLFMVEGVAVERVALIDIRANAPLFDDAVSGPGETAALSALIRPGYVASAVAVDQNTGVGGFVVPGDLIDVMHITQPDIEENPELFTSSILLQAVRVLGVDQNALRGPDAQVARTVTLEVDRRDVQVLALAASTGELSLALRGTGETVFVTAPDMRSDRIKRAAKTSTPRPKVVTPRRSAKPRDDRANVKVVRGDAIEQITVRREDAVQAAALNPNNLNPTELTLAGGQ